MTKKPASTLATQVSTQADGFKPAASKKAAARNAAKNAGKTNTGKASAGKAGGSAKAVAKTAAKAAATNGNGADRLARALANFSFDAPELDPLVDSHAYHSGNYPYDDRPKRKQYQKQLRALQIELLKLQGWVKAKGERVVLVFEGRDAAGKGGTIHRLTQHLNPRTVRVVALPKPSEVEAGQWYYQRYINHMPSHGEIVIFDRSWYNRAVVEPVMGFCTPQETAHFLEQTPVFERMLVDDGIRLFKFWLDIGREMQLKRLYDRQKDPLKRWKLSPIDLAAPARWDAITKACQTMITTTHQPPAPWTVTLSNDKMRARLNVIRHVLTHVPYDERDDRAVGVTDPAIVMDGHDFLARRTAA